VTIILIFQLWCSNHLLICNAKFNIRISKFPRLLHWMNVKVGDNVIRSAFHKDVVSIFNIHLVWLSLILVLLNKLC